MGRRLKALVNTSPLIFLAKAGLLSLLKEVFSQVYTTRQVLDEVTYPLRHGISSRDAELIARCAWIRIVELSSEELEEVERARSELNIDKGEASLLVAYRRGFDLVITADRRAERRFKAKGLNVMDLSELLLLAGREGIVDVKKVAKKVWDAGYRVRRIKRFMA